MSAKEVVLDIVQKMPDSMTSDDILDELNLRKHIEEGIRQLDAGEGIPHDEAMKRLSCRLG